MQPEDPSVYGCFVTGGGGALETIVEAKDATEAQCRIRLYISGVMTVAAGFLPSLLQSLGMANAQNEMYLTDIATITRACSLVCRAVEGSPESWLA